MNLVFQKLCVLFWKCVLLRWRNWLLTLLDLAAPIAVIFLSFHTLHSFHEFMHKDIDKNQKYIGVVTYKDPTDILTPPENSCQAVYCPINKYTEIIMENYFNIKAVKDPPVAKDNESDVESWLYNERHKDETFLKHFGIVFLKVNKENQFKYKIRNPYVKTAVPGEDKFGMFDPYQISGLLQIQALLDISFMNMTGIIIEKDQGFLGPFPTVNTLDLSVAFTVMYIIMTLAYVFLVIAIVRDVIQEKSSGTKELMKIMGVSSWMIWVQWVIYTLIVHLPVTIVATYLLTCYKSPVIPANVVVVWLLLFLFTINCITLLFVLTCLFNSPTTGTVISVGAWFIVHFTAVFYLNPNNFRFLLQIIFCLLPLNNLIWVFSTIASFYGKGVPWTLKHLFTVGSTGSYISVGLSITIFILETIILIIILIVLDAIKPGPYGVAKPITFICEWCKTLLKGSKAPDYVTSALPNTYEPPPERSTVGIEIRDLFKCYGFFNKVVAVEKVDLDIYEGEIMALLGHNGAGKTTTMSMITGMFSPTKGVIRFNGEDISKSSNYRNSLGICTQHNLYFPKFTVIEHLIFFGMLRGMSYMESKLAGLEQLKYLNMSKKVNSFGAGLSGGMKRRLCLAMSLMGNPKYLILDEPTSGLDPQSRRQIWNIILKMRGHRTILITTHFMEEADVLSDRIAIMDHGNIVCCGTTMFLKRTYGIGYQLHILKTPGARSDNILNKVRQYVANPQMKLVSPTQIDFTIKDESINQLPSMFALLEDIRDSLGITGISITFTTLEDAFLKVATNSVEGEPTTRRSKVTPKSSVINERTNNWDRIEGFDLLRVHYNILIWKNLRYQLRKIITTVITVIFTFLMVWYIISKTVHEKVLKTNQPPLPINLDIFKGYSSVIVYDDESKAMSYTATSILESHNWNIVILPYSTNITSFIIDLFIEDYLRYSQTLLALSFTKRTVTIQYQDHRLHLSAVAANLMTNILFRNATADNTSSIEVINHPYVAITEECEGSMLYYVFNPIGWMFLFSFSLILLMMDIIPLLIEDRVSGFKHQQTLAGVSPILYWLANFTYHYFFYLCIIVIYILIILIVGGKVPMESGFIGLLFLVLSLYGISGIFFVYLFTFFVDKIATSLSLFIMGNILLVVAQSITVAIAKNTLITGLFCLNPLLAVWLAIQNIASGLNYAYVCNVCNIPDACLVSEQSFLVMHDKSEYGILLYVLFLGLSWLLYFGIILLIDYGCIRRISLLLYHGPSKYSVVDEDDDDVKKEYEQIRLIKETNDVKTPLIVNDISKQYICGPKAVISVSFVVFPGDCFGLLGVNGAGKTTTFKILTGEIFPDSGDAVILGHSVISSRRKYQNCIGYCPQFDAFVNSFTGEEILVIIGRLRGIPRQNLKEEVDQWMKTMGISEYAKIQSGGYSGGTKRKLSTAMAFIGNPVVVFLDEPTSGVDPVSRRKLWSVVQTRQGAGQAIVLTSHSMEECEALCTRLTIMRDGQMKCIGSSEYLKNKFSQGYTVLVKLKNPTEIKTVEFKAVFKESFPSSVIVDEHVTQINYQILDPNVPLSQLFTIMLQLKSKYDIIEDFSVSNTSMEQLFMYFAKDKKG